MGTWGYDLWDQRDQIEKHTIFGIEFLEKCSSFVKDKIKIEQDYAKSLRQLVKKYQFKKKEIDDLPYTYQQAFRQFLKETDDYAGQREIIAEETKDKVLNDMHNLAGHSKNERKKGLENLNELKRNLEQLHKALLVAKSRYDKASEDSNTAFKNHEAAMKSLDMTKAQILKFQKISMEKKSIMDKCKDDYEASLDNFNKTQKLYYEAEFPEKVQKELQIPEENRIQKLSDYFKEMSNIQRKVQPIIAACLDGMVKAADTCDPAKDSLTLIDAYKTGEQPPHDIAFDKWGSTVNLAVPSPKPGGVKRVTKKERPKQRDPNIADDFADLPIAQRIKKYKKKIKELQDQISHEEKSMNGLLKMKDTLPEYGVAQNSMVDQINVVEQETIRLRNLLTQYEAYLQATETNGSSRPVSTVSADFPAPPQPQQQQPEQQQQHNFPPPPAAEQAAGVPPPPPPPPSAGGAAPTHNDEFDELRCTVLYDFAGTNEGELSVYSGEELVIIEDDDGGWTRVLRGDEEGYIPSSYINKL